MKRTKVIQLIYGLGDGGAEALVKDYASMINKELFDIIIVVIRLKENSAVLRQVNEANIKVVPIYRHWNLLTKAWQFFFGKWYVPFVFKRIVKKYQANVIHAHFGMLKILNRIEKSLEGIRLFYTCHNKPEMYFGEGKEEERKAAENLIKYKKLRLIALHGDMANELNEMFNVKNSIVIRNGVDFKRFRDNKIDKTEKRRELNIPEDAFVLGHVGRFMEQKNHKFLVDVFYEAAILNEKAFLIMVGAGDSSLIEEKLNKLGLGDRYIILRNRTDVNEIMQVMDVFVFPSLFEGLPLVLIEAQASGLKCVAANTINVEAFNSEKAISVPLGDTKQWVNIIMDNTVRGKTYSNLEDYDMNNVIKQLEKLYLG